MEVGTFVRVSATLKSSLNEFDDFTFALEYKNARDKNCVIQVNGSQFALRKGI